MPDATTHPGPRLRIARLAAGLSQAELAARLGIPQSYVARVETGVRVPTLDWLWGAARALGCRAADLDDRLARRVPH
jgi:transcriptional regulator with XRE-family HTH domain